MCIYLRDRIFLLKASISLAQGQKLLISSEDQTEGCKSLQVANFMTESSVTVMFVKN